MSMSIVFYLKKKKFKKRGLKKKSEIGFRRLMFLKGIFNFRVSVIKCCKNVVLKCVNT